MKATEIKEDFAVFGGDLILAENAKIGGNVTLGPRIKIGKNALIGFGSVVTSDVPENTVAFGNPAKVQKNISDLSCILGYYDTPYEWEARDK